MYDDNGSEGPRCTFEIYRAEADALYKQGEYRKAIESYTTALEIQESEKNCLVARSKCYLQLGDMQSALDDAEASLKEDKEYHKGIYQKAQALYYQGDFEMALVFYHRGLKLRPELHEFRLGIQKAQEAIDNSVGCKSTDILFPNASDCLKNVASSKTSCSTFTSLRRRKSDWSLSRVFGASFPPSSVQANPSVAKNTSLCHKAPETVKLTTEGDLSYFQQQLDDKKIKNKGKTYGRPTAVQQKTNTQRQSVGSEKTIKQLLGELYGDRQYLEKLLKETDPNSEMGKTISSLVNEGLSYLDTRSDFWRQQKPLYARRHDRIMQRRKREVSSSKALPNDYIIKELERIDQAQVQGKYQEALKRSQKCLSTVQNFSEDDVPNKVEVIANLHSCIGNAYLEMGSCDKSLESHQIDLSMGESNDMLEAVSRALDNIGRVHARKGDFKMAISVWERKLPMSKSPLESTWLFHEIGRCYLESTQFSEAKNYGMKSEDAALEAEDQMWQLQASVLVAQAEVKLGELNGAAATFEKALDLAKSQSDKSAQTAIQKAIDEINERIAAGEGIVNEGDGTADGTVPESNNQEEEPASNTKQPEAKEEEPVKEQETDPAPQKEPEVTEPEPKKEEKEADVKKEDEKEDNAWGADANKPDEDKEEEKDVKETENTKPADET